MPNELLWFVLLFLNFFTVCSVYRFLGKTGLLAYTVMATILTNIQVVVTLDLFSMTVTLGNITYACNFLVTDVLSEYHSKEDARTAVVVGFISMVATTVIMFIITLMTPNETGIESFESIKNIFSIQPRIVIASMLSYLISQNIDISLFKFFKTKLPSRRFLWLRNTGSTLISQAIDNITFNSLAFAFIFPASTIITIIISTYVLKTIISVLDTPFVYLVGKIKPKNT